MKKKKKKKIGKDVEKAEHLYTAGKMVEPLWKQVWQFLKKHRITISSNNYTHRYFA